MTKPKWIIFDIGGVLFDYKCAFDEINKYFGIDSTHVMSILDKYIGRGELGTVTFDQVWLDILKPLHKENELGRVVDMWWSEEYWYKDTLYLVSELKKSGYHLAILTNNWNDMGPKLKLVTGINNFDYIFESSVIKLRKPDPAIFQYVEGKIDATGNDILLIDDTKKNVTAAQSIGWQTLFYEYPSSNVYIEKLINQGNYDD